MTYSGYTALWTVRLWEEYRRGFCVGIYTYG